MFIYFKKLTAGLLVFLFFVLPFRMVFADEALSEAVAPIEQASGETDANTTSGQPEDQSATEENAPAGEAPSEPEVNAQPEADQAESVTEDPKMPVENNLKKKLAQPDEATGALLYSYDIAVPSGRNGIEPHLALTYNSQDRELSSLVGQGWSLNIPSIQLLNKKGIEKMYSEPVYASLLSDELVSTVSGTFKPKVDNGDFISYAFANSTWTATDKAGTTYTFGATAAARQDDPSDASRVYKWLLEKTQDRNGNYVRYEYYKDQGQIYPSKIFYSGNGNNDGIFEVEFLRQTRSDQLLSSKSGFAVKTSYRINEIQTKINGSWVKKYTLSYGSGDNTVTSLINSITEQGKDEAGNIVSLPGTMFEYDKIIPRDHWEINTTTWTSPAWIGGAIGGMTGDINGDGWDDLLLSQGGNNGEWLKGAYINNGQGQFVENTQYEPPFRFTESNGADSLSTGASLVDVNGDGLLDLINAGSNSIPHAFLNTGTGWAQAGQWVPPMWFAYRSTDPSASIANLNGDNLPDIIGSRWEWNGQNVLTTYAYINTGNGWTRDLSWQLPIDLRSTQGTVLADVNGDGLDDIVQSVRRAETIKKTFLNNGRGQWIDTPAFAPQPLFFDVDYYDRVIDHGYRFVDINGDSLVDIIENGGIYRNTGAGWQGSTDVGWQIPGMNLGGGGSWTSNSRTAYITNLDGNAMVDVFQTSLNVNNGVDTTVARNLEKRVNLLKKITYDTGGSTQITYQSTPLYRSGSTLLNPSLSMIIDTVKDVTTSDGASNPSTTSYSYEGGAYYYNSAAPQDGKFAGFSKVTRTDPNLSVTKTYYHQGNTSNSAQGEYQDHVSKIGKPYLLEKYGATGNLFSRVINKWDRYDLGNGRNFVKLTQTLNLNYDGDSSHDDTAVTYTYDSATGNQTEVKQWGKVTANVDATFTDNGTDAYITTLDYATNPGAGIYGLPARQIMTNQAGIKISETRNYYDSLPLGQASLGNLTKTEQWKNGSSYVTATKTYNSFGLVTEERDPRNNPTTYVYDAANVYPVAVTNALNQTTIYEYDYSLGKAKKTIDPNGFVTEVTYDGLDRVSNIKQSDEANPASLVMKTAFEYTDTPNAVSIKKTDYLEAANAVDAYTYYDGVGRPIQERRESEDVNQFIAKDTLYNSQGLIWKESLPYLSSGSGKTSPTSVSSLYAISSYDAVDRPVTVANAVGTTNYVYDGWKTAITDADGKVKDLYRDAYGNLTQVDEHYNRAVYSTFYSWNGLKKLTQITDASRNVRNFEYDGLGRALSAQDLHDPSDSTYGEWTYEYDDAGNMIARIDPKNQAVEFVYDALNRVTSENYSGGGLQTIYEYDACGNGVGRLCRAVTPDMTEEYEYTIAGNVAQERKLIAGNQYETAYVYDRQGNQTTIANPDNSVVAYEYNAGGQVERVEYKEAAAPVYQTLVSDFDYNPAGLVTQQVFTTGVTTNTYDDGALYRLSHKVTTVNSGGVPQTVQDISYTYDPVGNILMIVDVSETLTAKTVTYGYDDLHRLIEAKTEATPWGGDPITTQEIFAYDPIGNIISTSTNGTYLYEGNRGDSYANPHAVTNVNGMEYRYDENGNMLNGNNGATYVWDYNNRLRQVKNDTHDSLYTYDASGQRATTQVDGGSITAYPSAQYNAGDKVTKHITANGLNIATIENDGTEEKNYLLHTDHLSGSNIVSDGDGAVVETTDYTPFGDIRVDEKAGEFSEQRKFTGHEYDVESGLTYANARYYDAKIGRWLSEDSVFQMITDPASVEDGTGMSYSEYLADPQMLNAYSYVTNNPLKYVDITGNARNNLITAFGSYMAQGQRAIGNFLASVANSSSQAGGALGHSSAFLYNSAASVAYDTANVFDPQTSGGDKLKSIAMLGATVASGGEGKAVAGVATATKAAGWTERTITGAQAAAQQAKMLKGMENPAAQRFVKKTFQLSDSLSGGTPAAAKWTQETGQLLKGSDHIQRNWDTLRGGINLIKNEALNSRELKTVKNIINRAWRTNYK